MARSLANLRKAVDNLTPENLKQTQTDLRRELDVAEAAHKEEMESLQNQIQTAQDQSGLHVYGPEGMEGPELDEFNQEVAEARKQRLLQAPLSEGELASLQDPLYQQGGTFVDPLDPRPLRTPLEAAAERPALILNRARGI